MNKPAEVSDLASFLRLLEVKDLSEVEEILLARTQFHDDDGEVEVGVSGVHVSVMLIGAGIDGQGFDIAFPFTLDEFWREVDEVDRLNLRRVNLNAIPDSPLNEPDGFIERLGNADFVEALALYFERHQLDLSELIGGGWGTLDLPVGDVEIEHFERVWIYAGDPLMAAMGLGRDDVKVGSPTLIHLGMAGPAWVAIDEIGNVDLDANDRFELMAHLLRSATERSLERCGICWGCRTLQVGVDQTRPSICRDCGTSAGVTYD